MFKLTSKLALSNLIKNRSLYYPFALATVLATAILYSFVSLAHSPNMEASYGGTAAHDSSLVSRSFRLPSYPHYLCQRFVMKNRSQELGVYSVLRMEKRHLLLA